MSVDTQSRIVSFSSLLMVRDFSDRIKSVCTNIPRSQEFLLRISCSSLRGFLPLVVRTLARADLGILILTVPPFLVYGNSMLAA